MKHLRRTIVIALLGCVAMWNPSTPSTAAFTSKLDIAKTRREHLAHQISRLRHGYRRDHRDLSRRIHRQQQLLHSSPPHARNLYRHWQGVQHAAAHALHVNKAHMRRMTHRYHLRLRTLIGHRRDALRYVQQYGLFHTCPVRGYHVVDDNFGVVVRIPHVPTHIHQGDDIAAYYGTPVVAPFAGTAVAAPNELGGLAVKVYGPLGYVYNAHLSRYGALGKVNAGQVIGYVGATGDARGPHDHFEWHPHDGAAVDPYPFLSAVC